VCVCVCVFVGDSEDRALLEDAKHFTVLIKNYIEFPKFGQKRSEHMISVVSVSDLHTTTCLCDTVIMNVDIYPVCMIEATSTVH